MTSNSIRYLRDGDPLPEGEPRRYSDPRGYVRLRWKIGPYQYVEAWEHRVLAGRPAGRHVHHVDEDKTNNIATNLDPTQPGEHSAHHHRRVNIAEAGRLYASGCSSYDVARLLHCDPSNAWRAIKKSGVRTRSKAEARKNFDDHFCDDV